MSKNDNKIKFRSDRKFMRLLLALLIAFFAITIIFGLVSQCRLNKQKATISDMEKTIISMSMEATIVDPNLDFLKEQIKFHQEFIESERSFLVWMLGVIFTVGGALICFFSFKSKKDLEEMLEKQYNDKIESSLKELDDKATEILDGVKNDLDDEIKSSVAKATGDSENLQYLKHLISVAKREAKALSKTICFIKQKDSKAFEGIIKWAREFYNENASDRIKEEYASPELFTNLVKGKKYDIFVYEVSRNEFGDKRERYDDSTEFEYKILNDFCKEQGKRALLFCKEYINRDIIDNITTPAKFEDKLRETLSSLLSV